MYNNNKINQLQSWHNGPAPGQLYNTSGFYNENYNMKHYKEFTAPGCFGTQHTMRPINTGTTVVGVTFDKGVIIAADNLISYGSLARFQDVQRVFSINDKIIIGAGGDFADFQYLKRRIDQKPIEDFCYNDGIVFKPKSMYNWIRTTLYNRRSNMNPLWVDIVVGGMQDGVPFLGHVDLRGCAYQDKIIATGFGKHFALPLFREKFNESESLTQDEAKDMVAKCMEILYYRDCRALSSYTMAICTEEGSEIQGPLKVSENWALATMIKGY